MGLAVLATVFGVVFVAELPDKTAIASLILGSKYRPVFVFAGVAAAFTVHAALAVTAGSLLDLLPRRVVEAVAAAMFALGAVLLLRGRHQDSHSVEAGEGRQGFWRVAGFSFVVIGVAEFGDLTQLVTASLAARYRDPLLVGAGAVLALWAVAALAIAGGRGLLKVLPVAWVSRGAALVMLVLAGISLAAAVA